jgi:copper chaperone
VPVEPEFGGVNGGLSVAVIPGRGIVVSMMSDRVVYTVPSMSCEHCKAAVQEELVAVPGVRAVDVDLETKLVVVHGHELDDLAMRAAIEDAGYRAA